MRIFASDRDNLKKIGLIHKVPADVPAEKTSETDKAPDFGKILFRIGAENSTIDSPGHLHGLLKADVTHVITAASTSFAVSTIRNGNKGNTWDICTRFAVSV